MIEQYYTVRQLASKLQVSTDTILRKIRGGQITASDLAEADSRSLYRIPESEVRRLLDSTVLRAGGVLAGSGVPASGRKAHSFRKGELTEVDYSSTKNNTRV